VYEAVIWKEYESCGDLTAEDRVARAHGKGLHFPAVLENGKVATQQAFDPDTNENWTSEEEALAWANRWIQAVTENTSELPEDTSVIRFE